MSKRARSAACRAAAQMPKPGLNLGLWWHRAHPLGRAGFWLRDALMRTGERLPVRMPSGRNPRG